MKLPALVAVLALFAGAAPLRAGLEQWQVRVEMQIVSVPTQVALQIVPPLRDPRQVAVTVADLQTKIARGEATLLAWPMFWTKSGQRGSSEDIEEIRYPTEFEPPQVPGVIPPRRAPPVDGLPNAYETRNLGVMFEANPLVRGDGTWVDLELDALRVAFFGFRRFGPARPERKLIGAFDQPRFFTARTTTSMFVRNGEWTLVANPVVSAPEPHIELFLLRATAQRLAR